METVDQPITVKQGIALIEKMSIAEFALDSAIARDNGPLTSTPHSRRSMAVILRDLASSYHELADKIDPLHADADIRWQAVEKTTTEN